MFAPRFTTRDRYRIDNMQLAGKTDKIERFDNGPFDDDSPDQARCGPSVKVGLKTEVNYCHLAND